MPPEEIRITVLWDVARLSPNARMHPGKRLRLEREAKAAAGVGYALAGHPRIDGPVDVRLLLRRARKLDDDNAIAACKHARDVLFNRNRFGTGITPDDDAAHVRVTGVDWETGPEWRGREEVVFIVTPRLPTAAPDVSPSHP